MNLKQSDYIYKQYNLLFSDTVFKEYPVIYLPFKFKGLPLRCTVWNTDIFEGTLKAQWKSFELIKTGGICKVIKND